MSVFAAVLFFSLVRAVLAGYGGIWFFPGVLGEALNASLTFFLIAVADGALRRFSRMTAARTRAVMRTVEYVALFAYFGKAWVEPHAALADVLSIDTRLSLPLAAIGGGVGLLATRLERRSGTAVAEALLWTVAGWLIVGPWLYSLLDDIESSRRIASASLIALSFVAVAAGLAAIARLVGVRRLRFLFGASVAVALGVALLVPGPKGADESESVLLIVVDSLRADSLDRRKPDGSWLMPRVRELAARGVRFTDAVAPAPWSLPSTVSILSGINPHHHYYGRLRGDTAIPGDRGASYLGAVLRAQGYQTAGFVNNGQLRPCYGFGDDFLRFRRYHGDAHDGTALVLSWIVRHRARPFFVFLHLRDPRWPYDAPVRHDLDRDVDCIECDDPDLLATADPSPEVRREVRRRYDAELGFTDLEIGRLLDELAERELLGRLWIVLTASNGQEFWEHGGIRHGLSLYDEVLRVPMVVVPPDGRLDTRRGSVVDQQVRLEDIAPTVLEVIGATGELPRELDGESLMRLVTVGNDDVPRPLLAGYLSREGDSTYAVRADGYKLIVPSAADGDPELYDLGSDPREQVNLAGTQGHVVKRLRHVPREMGFVLPQPGR